MHRREHKKGETKVAKIGQDSKEGRGKCNDYGEVLSNDSPSGTVVWGGFMNDIKEKYG